MAYRKTEKDVDQLAQAIRDVVWIPGCAPDDPGTWDQISDDAKYTWRRAAHAALNAIYGTTDGVS